MSNNILYKNCVSLGVVQSLTEKFELIYLDAPYYSGRDLSFGSEHSIRHQLAEENDCKISDITIEDVATRRKHYEQKSMDEFMNYIVQLLKSCKEKLKDEGILCFLVPGERYSDINYRLVIEQIFPSFKEITLERRKMPHATGKANNDSLFFLSNVEDYDFPVLMELPDVEKFASKDDVDYYRLMTAESRFNRPANRFEFQGILPSEDNCWSYSNEKMNELLKNNRIVVKNGKVYIKRYRGECQRVVSDVWKDEDEQHFTGNTSIGSVTINKILDMCVPADGRVLLPYERDGKFTYVCTKNGIEWVSIYTPLESGRLDYIQQIPTEIYSVIENQDYYVGSINENNVITSTRAARKIQVKNQELAEVNSGLRHENEELLEINVELIDENTDLRKENDELKARVNTLMDSIRQIQLSVGIEETDEVTIDLIIEKIHNQTMTLMSSMNFEQYIPIAEEWMAPHWNLLESESKKFIPTGLMLGDILDKIGDGENADKAPVVIEYCKTLEKELFQKIFCEYVKYLIKERINVKEAFQDSYKKVDGKKNKKSRVFADFLNECTTYNKCKPEEWHFEIGKMARVLMMTLEGVESDVLFIEFRKFLEKIFDEEFFKQEFEKSLDEIAELRNKCAHPNVVDEDNATSGKAAIREKLINILKYYK